MIDFSEIEVEEYADAVEYENALPTPVNFEKESVVWEKHDQGYAPVLTRSSDGVSIEYLATSWDAGVWKSRLYIKTSLVPASGVHYHVMADVTCVELLTGSPGSYALSPCCGLSFLMPTAQ